MQVTQMIPPSSEKSVQHRGPYMHRRESLTAGQLSPTSQNGKNTHYKRPQQSLSNQTVTNQTDQLPELETHNPEVGTQSRGWYSSIARDEGQVKTDKSLILYPNLYNLPSPQMKKYQPNQNK